MCQTIFMARHFHECFPYPHDNLEGGQLLPFIGEEIGPERESKLIKFTQLHSYEKDIIYYILSGTVLVMCIPGPRQTRSLPAWK